ncbi:MAG: hypothetical protein AAF368_12385 [Planctomycetota bacterium]
MGVVKGEFDRAVDIVSGQPIECFSIALSCVREFPEDTDGERVSFEFGLRTLRCFIVSAEIE